MIRIEGLRKSWPGFTLEIEHLEIGAGEYFVVLGPSGAGKTVLLSCLGGLVQPDSGRIWFDDRDVTDLAPERRTVGWVSQSNTLFPHLTVAGNIRFGRRYCRTGSDRFDARVARLIELLDLAPLPDRRPADLSGGEIRRAMLARALALEPRVLLLDEPLIGLDPTTQERLRDELARIHRELGTTTFHITHDHVEARALADRIAVLRAGRIEQVGAADEVFERPATCFVARFTGAENLFALSESAASDEEGAVQFLDRRLLPPGLVAAAATHVAIRPEHVELWPEGNSNEAPPPGSLRLRGTIESLAKHGSWQRVTVRCGDALCVAFVHPREAARHVPDLGRNADIVVAGQHICLMNEGMPRSGQAPRTGQCGSGISA
jgi:ABC-type Fe3+/spermidine/putrescine transport system ATPase subunit